MAQAKRIYILMMKVFVLAAEFSFRKFHKKENSNSNYEHKIAFHHPSISKFFGRSIPTGLFFQHLNQCWPSTSWNKPSTPKIISTLQIQGLALNSLTSSLPCLYPVHVHPWQWKSCQNGTKWLAWSLCSGNKEENKLAWLITRERGLLENDK